MTSADDIADAVVAIYNAIEAKEVEFEAVNPEDLPEFDLTDGKNSSVQVYGFAEDETPENLRDDCLRINRVVRTLVMLRKADGVTKKTFLKFINQLKEQFREMVIEVDGERFSWEGTEHETIYDFDVLAKKRCFLTAFNSTFQTFG